jgi:hypothetical protein
MLGILLADPDPQSKAARKSKQAAHENGQHQPALVN